VKQRIRDDPAGRLALWQQLQVALAGEPDPWCDFERAQVDVRQFQPLNQPLDPAALPG